MIIFSGAPMGRIGNRVRIPDGPATVSRYDPGISTGWFTIPGRARGG